MKLSFLGFIVFFIWLSNVSAASELNQNKKFELTYFIGQIEKKLQLENYIEAECLVDSSLNAYFSENNLRIKADYAFLVGDVYHYRSKFQLSVYFFETSFRIYKLIHDPLKQAEASVGLMETHRFLKNYEKAINYGYIAMKILKEQKDFNTMNDVKSILGNTLIEYGSLDEGYSFLNQVYKDRIQDSIHIELAYSFEDFAGYYFKSRAYHKALGYANKSLKIYLAEKDVEGEITTRRLMSECFLALNELDSAILYSKISIGLIEKKQDKRGIKELFFVLANTYLRQKDFKNAWTFATLFNQYGQQSKDPTTAIEYTSFLINYYESKGDYKASVRAGKEYVNLIQSYKRKEKQLLIAEMNAKYKLEEKENEIRREVLKGKLLAKEIKIQKSKRRLIWIVFSGVGICLFVLFVFLRFKHLKSKELLQKEILLKSSKLNNFLKVIQEKNKLIIRFENQLNDLFDDKVKAENDSMNKLIQLKILTEDDWLEFQYLYREVFPGFIEKLKDSNHDFSEGDIRHLLLVNLNLSTKEIAGMLGVSISSVRVSRHRLRKKLDLKEDIDLKDVLNQF
jgi:hypothetical protein